MCLGVGVCVGLPFRWVRRLEVRKGRRRQESSLAVVWGGAWLSSSLRIHIAHGAALAGSVLVLSCFPSLFSSLKPSFLLLLLTSGFGRYHPSLAFRKVMDQELRPAARSRGGHSYPGSHGENPLGWSRLSQDEVDWHVGCAIVTIRFTLAGEGGGRDRGRGFLRRRLLFPWALRELVTFAWLGSAPKSVAFIFLRWLDLVPHPSPYAFLLC